MMIKPYYSINRQYFSQVSHKILLCTIRKYFGDAKATVT